MKFIRYDLDKVYNLKKNQYETIRIQMKKRETRYVSPAVLILFTR